MQQNANFYAFMFGVAGAISYFATFARVGIFAVSGERLTRRLRLQSFIALIRQDMGFFDDPDHGSGSLNAKLSTESEHIRGLSGSTLGSIIQALSTLAVGLGIAFASSWQLTLVILATLPLMAAASTLHVKILAGFGGRSKKAYEDASQIATEAIENVRTVYSLVKEDFFVSMYAQNILGPHRLVIRGTMLSSFGYGLSQALTLFAFCLAFYYGAQLIIWKLYDVNQVFRALFAVIFAGISMGQISSVAPNLARSKIAALDLFDVLDKKSTIDPMNKTGVCIEPFNGSVTARDVHFSYPARPETKILRGLDVDVKPGTRVAIVGASGSGKSTLVSLVQRFYDVESGTVKVQNADVRDWNISELRAHMAMVGQEPVLFDRTIAENIAYGVEGASQELIEASARAANIHDFIVNLPKGYKTRVGERGTQLSGGQKQRVAIARALIRNPKLLLLDEATSALDSESEKIVQYSLDKASLGRTAVVIAHRLSTIQDADFIFVVRNGEVVEKGQHADLIALQGFYSKLVRRQALSLT